MLPKLIVIEGTNASGKSALGVELASRFGGEIVSADSRQVYERMDLGSGKITPEEMKNHGDTYKAQASYLRSYYISRYGEIAGQVEQKQ